MGRNNRRIVYVFLQNREDENPENIKLLNNGNDKDYLNDASYKVLEKYNTILCGSHLHFKKSLPPQEMLNFLDELKATLNFNFYFAVKRGGDIWKVNDNPN